MKGVLSKRQRERKRKRGEMNEILGDRMNDWRTFAKKATDEELTEKQKDDKYGDAMLQKKDQEQGLVSLD